MNGFRTSLLVLLASGGLLSACSPEKPWLMESSSATQNQMRLVESRHVVKKPLNAISSADIQEAARLYGKNGAGPMYVVVAYKEHGKMSNSAIAGRKAQLLSGLQEHGIAVRDIVASEVPLETPEPVALIAFDTLEAQGPKDCTPMPGFDTGMVEENNLYDYRYGCAVKSVMARQIANPRDLEGRAGLGGRTDGEHAANVVTEQARPGAPKAYLPTYVISELANSGG